MANEDRFPHVKPRTYCNEFNAMHEVFRAVPPPPPYCSPPPMKDYLPFHKPTSFIMTIPPAPPSPFFIYFNLLKVSLSTLAIKPFYN